MKLFLSILLFAVLVSSQTRSTKITAYRFIEQYNDGPCSIVSYINTDDYKGSVAKSVFKDALLTQKLIGFREEITKGTSIPFHCSKKWIGGDIVDAIIVLHMKINDTLFFSEKRNLLVIPNQNKAYSYSREAFLKILNSKMNTFFTRDFETERRKLMIKEK